MRIVQRIGSSAERSEEVQSAARVQEERAGILSPGLLTQALVTCQRVDWIEENARVSRDLLAALDVDLLDCAKAARRRALLP